MNLLLYVISQQFESFNVDLIKICRTRIKTRYYYYIMRMECVYIAFRRWSWTMKISVFLYHGSIIRFIILNMPRMCSSASQWRFSLFYCCACAWTYYRSFRVIVGREVVHLPNYKFFLGKFWAVISFQLSHNSSINVHINFKTKWDSSENTGWY